MTKRIIAMGFPASDLEGAYRNNIDDVQAFFDRFHNESYRFYNLCSERTYPSDRFHGHFVRFPFDDHNPPPLGMFYFFCRDVEEYLGESEANVVAIHCKAGKGRTGVMISAYLMWSGEWTNPNAAMEYYGAMRTQDMRGVTIPSQRRFVEYFFMTLATLPAESRGTTAVTDGAQIPSAWVTSVNSILPAGANNGLHRHRDRSEEDQAGDEGSASASESSHIEAECSYTEEADEGLRFEGTAKDVPMPIDKAETISTNKSVLDFVQMDAVAESLPQLWPDGQRPRPRRARRRLNHEWNRRNRLLLGTGRGALPPPKIIALEKLRIHHAPFSRYSHEYTPIFTVSCGDFEYISSDILDPCHRIHKPKADIVIPIRYILLTEEVYVEFYTKGNVTRGPKKSFCFWFHCNFIPAGNRLLLQKDELDKACKDTKHTKFDRDFSVELCFVDIDQP